MIGIKQQLFFNIETDIYYYFNQKYDYYLVGDTEDYLDATDEDAVWSHIINEIENNRDLL